MKFRDTIKKLNLKLAYFGALSFFLLPLPALASCGEEEPSEGGYSIFYITKENDGLVERETGVASETTDELVRELIEDLSTDSGDPAYHKAIPTDVMVEKYQLDQGNLSLTFSDEYSKMDAISEVLCRAAVVETLIQIPDVMRVGFFVSDVPLADSKGNVVGFMTEDSFVQNPGRQINAIQETTLTLYFTDEEGRALCGETQKVHYSSNISMEKLVVERLLEGPLTKGLQATIPEGTQILSVSAVDGVCYVNLDDAFRNQNYEVQENVVIYSLVDSLTELEGVERVQISINGDTSGVYRDRMSLSTLYERNEDLIESSPEMVEEEVEVSEEQ